MPFSWGKWRIMTEVTSELFGWSSETVLRNYMRGDFQKTPPPFDISVVPILLLDKKNKKKRKNRVDVGIGYMPLLMSEEILKTF